MDELDVKIFRALASESAVVPLNLQIHSSLIDIARRLGIDDTTVNYRYKKLQDAGVMSAWKLAINPTYFGYRMMIMLVDVHPESAKRDMIRKLKSVPGVVVIGNFFGKAMNVMFLYDGDESCSSTAKLISRITNAEKVTLHRMALPKSETKQLTKTELDIIRDLSDDARKPYALVAKELGLSTRTVRNRIEKLRRERTFYAMPSLRISEIPGIIPVYLSYSYANKEVKRSVDQNMLSHFDGNYLWVGFSDPENGFFGPKRTDHG
ncbi:MAG: AsnC family transcriptional regulator [Nitrososphaerales archaeon]